MTSASNCFDCVELLLLFAVNATVFNSLNLFLFVISFDDKLWFFRQSIDAKKFLGTVSICALDRLWNFRRFLASRSRFHNGSFCLFVSCNYNECAVAVVMRFGQVMAAHADSLNALDVASLGFLSVLPHYITQRSAFSLTVCSCSVRLLRIMFWIIRFCVDIAILLRRSFWLSEGNWSVSSFKKTNVYVLFSDYIRMSRQSISIRMTISMTIWKRYEQQQQPVLEFAGIDFFVLHHKLLASFGILWEKKNNNRWRLTVR